MSISAVVIAVIWMLPVVAGGGGGVQWYKLHMNPRARPVHKEKNKHGFYLNHS